MTGSTDRCTATTWWHPEPPAEGGRTLQCVRPAGHPEPHADDDGDWTDD